jgi:large subunit ribosomal protein L24
MTQPRFKIKRGDFVQVMTGREKGKTGAVTKVLLSESRVVVEGVHKVVRFVRSSQANPEGRVTKTLSIHISNVAVVDPSTNKPGRIGYRKNKVDEIERFFKKTGAVVEENHK